MSEISDEVDQLLEQLGESADGPSNHLVIHAVERLLLMVKALDSKVGADPIG